MITLDEALAIVGARAAATVPLAAERVSLWSARGRVLAEDVHSAVDLPSADYSAMDGYALRVADFEGADQVTLRVLGECQTGHLSPALEGRGCLRIYTGAHLPMGADSVLMQEETMKSGDSVTLLRAPRVGENVRRRGEDVERGALLLSQGTRLLPHQLGLLASAERTEVSVVRRPRVSILCTGDELRPFGNPFYGGQLAESNSIALSGLAAEAGADVTVCPLVVDQLEAIKVRLQEATQTSDVVVTVGGVSVGDHDLVRPAIEAMGGRIIFHKVAIKPGKPVLLAEFKNSIILGLPGNPASAQVVFTLLGFPLLRGLARDKKAFCRSRSACMSHDFSHKPGRRSFYRALLEGDQVTVLSNQASGASTSMAWANALIDVDPAVSSFARDQRVPVWAFCDF
jgi:molybdopterin molybdotransferase